MGTDRFCSGLRGGRGRHREQKGGGGGGWGVVQALRSGFFPFLSLFLFCGVDSLVLTEWGMLEQMPGWVDVCQNVGATMMVVAIPCDCGMDLPFNKFRYLHQWTNFGNFQRKINLGGNTMTDNCRQITTGLTH